jgi:surface-anchored protein
MAIRTTNPGFTPSWSLPKSNSGPGGAAALNAPFLGIGSEELDPGDWTGDLSLTLTGMSGPGVFSLWQDGFSPTFFMSTFDGVSGADTISFTAGGHDHFNYGFTQPGLYEVTFEVAGTHSVDGFKTGSATYSFHVVGGYVPEPGSFGLLALGALVLRRLRGFTGGSDATAGQAKVRRERSGSRRKPRW